MGTNGGGGEEDGVALRRLQAINGGGGEEDGVALRRLQAINGGGGEEDGVALRRLQAILAGVEIPTRMQIFFSPIFVRIHTNEVIHIV